ncbi:DNA-binding CsgD family transcriptional regulator [Leucobacter exalbidus]|uniref:DNA-binding CsgD family transcriptional regulator n=1 Tax=Leucobacter exalbidus TaxID=662960 RepID=A0A940PP20_9MICO|nr:LuxR C-terminal-related transcriptional regulator [Leucobacter exalbidus]MBP1324964.1 DNA-binding CsgD family transcriptional regulator [Leucobacter exalbidus]
MMNPTDNVQRILQDAVSEFSRTTGFPLAFGGLEAAGSATITALAGHRSMSLHGLRVEADRGLGGKALAEGRPRLTGDYRKSALITHHYDAEISAEGIVALFAVPVLVDGRVRAVLYGGTRGASPGSSFAPAAAEICSSLAREIRVEDEVVRRVAQRQLEAPRLSGAMIESLREGHAELRRIAADVQDESIRARLTALEQKLTQLGAPPSPSKLEVHLTPREIDVLAHAALGATNVEIGRSLGLTESTVKSYLKTAMSKFDASTRHSAVAAARQAGLIR